MSTEVGESKVHQTSCNPRRPTLSLVPEALPTVLATPPSLHPPDSDRQREAPPASPQSANISDPANMGFGLIAGVSHICLLLGIHVTPTVTEAYI